MRSAARRASASVRACSGAWAAADAWRAERTQSKLKNRRAIYLCRYRHAEISQHRRREIDHTGRVGSEDDAARARRGRLARELFEREPAIQIECLRDAMLAVG